MLNEINHPGGNSGANLKSISHRCYRICMGADSRNHLFAPGLPLGWIQIKANQNEDLVAARDAQIRETNCLVDLQSRPESDAASDWHVPNTHRFRLARPKHAPP